MDGAMRDLGDQMGATAKKLQKYSRYRGLVLWIATAATFGVLSVLSSSAVWGSNSGPWYQVTVEQGESRGYHWAIGVKGPKHEPLREICALVSITEPSQDDAAYVEGRSSTDCGGLLHAGDSVSGSVAFGVGSSRLTVLTTLYRPIVRKVTFILDTGERRVYLPRTPDILARTKRGIPVFRYLVASFDGEVCIRRVTIFDGKRRVLGKVVNPPCSTGEGNV